MPFTLFIALLRGINVGGHNKIPMAGLRSLCSALGWQDVKSYIQSGNLLFQADAGCSLITLETELEQAIQSQFGLAIHVLVRKADDWPGYIQSNPYPTESQNDPNLVMLAVSKEPPKPHAAEELQKRAVDGEHVIQVGETLWIYYARSASKSKLSPALMDRLVGSPVTTRNWRTVLQLDALRQNSP